MCVCVKKMTLCLSESTNTMLYAINYIKCHNQLQKHWYIDKDGVVHQYKLAFVCYKKRWTTALVTLPIKGSKWNDQKPIRALMIDSNMSFVININTYYLHLTRLGGDIMITHSIYCVKLLALIVLFSSCMWLMTNEIFSCILWVTVNVCSEESSEQIASFIWTSCVCVFIVDVVCGIIFIHKSSSFAT